MISFIYFDVGGVVIDDFSGNNKWSELKEELGIDASNSKSFEALWSRYSAEICIDRDVDSLVPIMNKELGLKLPKQYSLLAAFVSRFKANPEIWPTINALTSQCRLGLLTNMYPRMLRAIEQEGIMPEIMWDQVIDSSVEMLQKPDRKIFELAEMRANVPHGEIFLIDNSVENAKAAKAFGWQTFLYNSADISIATSELSSFLDRQAFRKLY